MNTGYSIFGGPVETMDGAVRAVSIMPHYRAVAGFGADVVGVAAQPPPPPPPHGGLRTTHVSRALTPGSRYQGTGLHPSRIPPPMAHGGGGGMHPGAMVPGPAHTYQPHQALPMPPPSVHGGGGGAPGGWVGSRPPPGGMRPHHPFVPHQTMPLPAQPGCACPIPVPPPPCPGPMRPMGPPPQFHYYNPTPSSPLCPGSMVPYPDSAQMNPCGGPMGGGGHLWHPGGMYPITQQGPGLMHPNMGVLRGQLPVGAGVDIFGAPMSVEDPTMPRPIGPGCQPQAVAQAGTCQPRPQPQMAYNQGSRGIFGTRAGVFGMSPDGLGGWR